MVTKPDYSDPILYEFEKEHRAEGDPIIDTLQTYTEELYGHAKRLEQIITTLCDLIKEPQNVS